MEKKEWGKIVPKAIFEARSSFYRELWCNWRNFLQRAKIITYFLDQVRGAFFVCNYYCGQIHAFSRSFARSDDKIVPIILQTHTQMMQFPIYYYIGLFI
jgi:hypothetical protein